MISLLFGITVLSSIIIKKAFKIDNGVPCLFQIWSLILFLIIYLSLKPNISILNTYNLFNLKTLLLFIIAIVPTSIISSQNKRSRSTKSKMLQFIDGASMEIPQRLLAQNLFVILGVNSIVIYSLSLDILLNAIIWVEFILIQEMLQGKKLTRRLIPEVTASLWFSIWVGILYISTGNIIMPMLAHGLQRILTSIIGKGKKGLI